MQTLNGQLVYSATDLVGFLECRHLANLERAATEGHIMRPARTDPVLDRIAQKGHEHEARFLEDLATDGITVEEIKPAGNTSPAARIESGRDATLQALHSGADVVYQATFFDGRRLGYADFLRRVERPSNLGAWSYEVWDTKLARHAKASAVLQLCMYSEMLTAIQGVAPERMHLALGGVQRETVSFRVADYAAYYRSVARDFEQHLGAAEPSYPVATTPEPVEHCDICRWSEKCTAQWRRDDDLALVANLSARQRRALHTKDVTTRTALAELSLPLPEPLDGAGRDALSRIQAQANIQVRGERQQQIISERIPQARDREGVLDADLGLLILPEPSAGDLFFDIEGDPFFGSAEADGIDYLFGFIEPGRVDDAGQPTFHALWAIEDGTVTGGAERRMFENFIDRVMEGLAADPNMHVYHYAPYEPTAVKRLAGRYGTRETEVDQLLRGGVFVDLYRAVRQGIRASVESYSIKKLEPLYGFKRVIDLRDAGDSIVQFETWLELGEGQKRDEVLREIEGYNRDDCVSTLLLRNWLEDQRAALEGELVETLPRGRVKEPEETEDSEALKAVKQKVDQLTAGVPDNLESATEEQRGRWLLAQMLLWHRREAKSIWWRYFLLKNELTDEERLGEPDALSGLVFKDSWPDPNPRARSTIYRFSFPPQEHKISVGDSLRDPVTDMSAGTVESLDDEACVLELRLGTKNPPPIAATSLIQLPLVAPRPKPESLQCLADWVIKNGCEADGDFRAARDLLMRRLPRVSGSPEGVALQQGESPQHAARRLVLALDHSYLALQGPPGSGKSSVGAEMIVDLVAAGKRVGVTANSHKVIGELLDKVDKVARERAVTVRIGQRTPEEPTFHKAVRLKSTADAQQQLANGTLKVVGGTSWLWAAKEMIDSVDVLFIDEAGQMSLADALAAAPCAANLVLLGDPQQLDQPLQGIHPPGAERSALAHVLNGESVMPDHLGIFLDGTWRLHPTISAYTSEVFYEGRLHSQPGREFLALQGRPPLSGVGMRFISVPHEGHSSDAPEEAAAIAELLDQLLAAGATWTDASSQTKRLTAQDVLMITPYNAQVRALSAGLPNYRVGTVDKFQGQEAPISVYSMATSSSDEAPRGLEFLYSLNRLNVATSRAQCLAVVVASPRLLSVQCHTPRQMRLVNALARLVEVATTETGP